MKIDNFIGKSRGHWMFNSSIRLLVLIVPQWHLHRFSFTRYFFVVDLNFRITLYSRFWMNYCRNPRWRAIHKNLFPNVSMKTQKKYPLIHTCILSYSSFSSTLLSVPWKRKEREKRDLGQKESVVGNDSKKTWEKEGYVIALLHVQLFCTPKKHGKTLF